jgi:hypothetical protein
VSIDTERRPRVRPAIRRLAIIAFPILVLAAAHSVWDYIEIRRVARELELIRAKGEPFSYSTAVRPVGREAEGSDDAGRYYVSAGVLALRTGEIMDAYGRFGPLRTWLSGTGPAPRATELVDAASAFLKEWKLAFALIDTATALPFHMFPPGTEYNYQAAGLSNLTRLNAVRTLNASLAGDGDTAVHSAIAGIRLRRALRPVFFIATADHQVPALLSLVRPSDAALQDLDRTFETETETDFVADDLIRERARYLDNIARPLLRSNVPPGGPMDILRTPVGGISVFVNFGRPWIARSVTKSLRQRAEIIEIAKTPWPEKARRAQALLARPDPNPVPAYMPALPYFRAAARPDRLIVDRSSRIAIAVERYRRAHQDTLPTSLDELVPSYLKAIPLDPLNGQPLRYRVTADAYTVYSVGPDGDDDGGMLLQETPVGNAERFAQGADIGVRVLVKHP